MHNTPALYSYVNAGWGQPDSTAGKQTILWACPVLHVLYHTEQHVLCIDCTIIIIYKK